MRTYRMSFVSNSKSIQEPRFGIIRALKIVFPVFPVLLFPVPKKIPGERPKLVEKEGSEKEWPCDLALLALGFTGPEKKLTRTVWTYF